MISRYAHSEDCLVGLGGNRINKEPVDIVEANERTGPYACHQCSGGYRLAILLPPLRVIIVWTSAAVEEAEPFRVGPKRASGVSQELFEPAIHTGANPGKNNPAGYGLCE